MILIFAAVKQMENEQACAAVLWMFYPPGLRAGHMTKSYEWSSSSIFLQAATDLLMTEKFINIHPV